MIDVSVIIINYNTYKLTSECIRSVIALTNNISYEIILVDNASTETDPENFKKEFPGIKLIRSPVNSGFAKGNNLGIKMAEGEIILLLNSDTLLNDNSIEKSLGYIRSHDEIGVLGCRMTYPGGKIQYTARKFRSIGWELLDLFRFIPWLMPYKSRSRKMLGKYFRHDENLFCDWVNGAFFMFPKNILESLPGQQLDDRFFMYGEDQLWCEQVLNSGHKVFFCAETSIIHINSGSTNPERQLALRKTMWKNELEIMRARKGSGFYFVVFKVIFISKEAIRNLSKAVWFRLSGKLIR